VQCSAVQWNKATYLFFIPVYSYDLEIMNDPRKKIKKIKKGEFTAMKYRIHFISLPLSHLFSLAICCSNRFSSLCFVFLFPITPTHIYLHNYYTVVCNARAKGMDDLLNNIVLFATDIETYNLAKSIGITNIYYDELIFGTIPKEYANEYADDTFVKIMFAKIYSVHLISQLGYNFLFQDVDVIWYKNPLNVSV
jgi:hypothetical protein